MSPEEEFFYDFATVVELVVHEYPSCTREFVYQEMAKGLQCEVNADLMMLVDVCLNVLEGVPSDV